MTGNLRILIVDDDQRMAGTLLDIFRVKGYEAAVAYHAYEALEKIDEFSFDCVLSDIKMPDMNGVELYRAIKERHPDLPVVLMSAYSDDKLVRDGLEEGAIATLSKPLDINALLSLFSSLRKERSVAIVDDDPKFCETMGDILQARGFAVDQITDPHDVVGKLKANGQVVLLDMKLNDISGLDVLKEIREQYPHLPVILVTGYRDEMAEAIEAAFLINAYTCLYKPFRIEELLKLLTEVYHQDLGRILGQPVRKNK